VAAPTHTPAGETAPAVGETLGETVAETPAAPEPEPETQSGIPKALADLMHGKDVTEDEIRAVIAKKGYYPADTPWGVMDAEGFIDGWVVPFWPNIVEKINDIRFKGSLPF
jgi:hypothetical protein